MDNDMKNKGEVKVPSKEEALEILQKDIQERGTLANEEIQAILKKYNYRLEPTIVVQLVPNN